MNAFWGCDTTEMNTWADQARDCAAALAALLEDLADRASTVAWQGPDAEQFQAELSGWLTQGYGTRERLDSFLERIRAEGGQQDEASSPDSDGSGAGAPRTPAGTPLGGNPFEGSPFGAPLRKSPTIGGMPLSGPGGFNPFGPMAHPDPVGLVDRMREKIKDADYEYKDPWMYPQPAPPTLRSTGNEAPDLSISEDGTPIRTTVGSVVPGLGQYQDLMGVHEAMGDGLDRAEQGMVDAGYGQYTGVLAPLKVSHALSGTVLGENSVGGQVLGALDDQIANTMHTTGQVGDALLEGDLGRAASEAEMGLYRSGDAAFDVITASPLPAVAEAGSSILDAGADYLDPIAPSPVTDTMRGMADRIDADVAAWQQFSPGQRMLDLRYEYLPKPWDQSA